MDLLRHPYSLAQKTCEPDPSGLPMTQINREPVS